VETDPEELTPGDNGSAPEEVRRWCINDGGERISGLPKSIIPLGEEDMIGAGGREEGIVAVGSNKENTLEY
jgi:hypothetical protein